MLLSKIIKFLPVFFLTKKFDIHKKMCNRKLLMDCFTIDEEFFLLWFL